MFNSPPQVSFDLTDTIGCAPLSVTFNNTSVLTSYFLWNFGNGNLDSLNYTITENFNSPGTYVISLTISDTTCAFSDSAFATIVVSPSVSIIQNDSIILCKPVPITFTPSFTGNPTQFIWSSNSSFTDTLNSIISQSQLLVNDPQPGYYYLSASNGNCSEKDSVYLEFVSANLSLSLSNSICIGENATITATNSNPQVSFTYNWSPTSVIVTPTNGNQVVVSPNSSQYVYLNATSINGCIVNDYIFVNVSYIDPSTVIASTSENNVLPGSVVVLSGMPNALTTYSWSPSIDVNTPNQQITNATVNESTIYTLTVSDGICSKSDTVLVKVYQLICDDVHLFIPNAFTPNSDNFNDILYLRGYNFEKMIFRIFDRWGEMVFETSDQAIGWDGTFRGKKLAPDVFDYYLDITCIGGLNEIIKGNVTLMK
jgi:gliding motility-associated-like protein